MQGDIYKTIKAISEGIYKEKGSKFLAFAHPVETVEDAKNILESYRKIYYDARHVCYSYIIGPDGEITRNNDDGEPSGTAGRPIHGQILSFGLTNVLVVVIRYFGGVLLGTGGLVVAYKSAAADALCSAEIIEETVNTDFSFSFGFPFMNDVMRIIKSLDIQVVSQDFGMECKMKIRVRINNAERLSIALEKVESLRFENS